MAFADHGLSFLAWEAAERTLCTTIQLNTHFLDAIRLAWSDAEDFDFAGTFIQLW